MIKNYVASAAIPARRFVKPGGTAGQVTLAAAVSDKIFGISTEVAAATGERVDVAHAGFDNLIEAGAAFAAGDFLTSDGTGRGIVAAPAAGTNNRTGAVALEAATAAGDLIRVKVEMGMFQG